MNPRIIILIVSAVVVAGAAAFLARNYLLSTQPEQVQQAEKRETTRVLVTADNLPMGHIIEERDLTWQDWPEENLNPNYLGEQDYTIEDMSGRVVRYGITAGEPLTTTRLISPGERGFLAAVLAPGMRAITIAVNRTTGLAGFVFPGDRVDVILTHQLEVETRDSLIGDRAGGEDDEDTEDHLASVTILRNVRVLAVDTRTDDLNKTPELGKSVTVEVTPKMAEKVALIQRMGIVSLSLRSITRANGTRNAAFGPDEDLPSSTLQTHTWDYQASHLVEPIIKTVDVKTLVIARGRDAQILILGATGNFETRDKDSGR